MSITINGTTGISGIDGSASAPAVQGTDSNTGVFFPAADTVSIATNGTERVRVDSSGNVGIGTSSPLTGTTTFVNAKDPVISGDGGYLGGGLYYDAAWRNTQPSQGGWAVRNSGGIYTVWSGQANGAVGSSIAASERFRINESGAFGLSGANYGTSGQVLTSGGSGTSPSWTSRGFASTTITNTSRASATVFQNTTNGHMLVTVVGQNNGAVMYAGATAGGIFQVSRQNATYTAVSCMVPPGWYYRADYSVLNSWIEGQ